MRVSGFARISALALSIALTPFVTGCGSNPFNPPIDPGGDGHAPGDTPDNNTQQNTMTRFKAAYEYQDLPKYENLLSADFRYTFSNDSDPALVTQYGNNWGKIDEVESARHLFDGFQNSLGNLVPAASQIQMTLSGAQYDATDPFHADSTQFYKKVVISRVQMQIDIPPDQIFNIDARHEFYLVRGDVALLDAGQEARADRWYIRRWDDLSVPITGTGSRVGLSSVDGSGRGALTRSDLSWGQMKDSYRR